MHPITMYDVQVLMVKDAFKNVKKIKMINYPNHLQDLLRHVFLDYLSFFYFYIWEFLKTISDNIKKLEWLFLNENKFINFSIFNITIYYTSIDKFIFKN